MLLWHRHGQQALDLSSTTQGFGISWVSSFLNLLSNISIVASLVAGKLHPGWIEAGYHKLAKQAVVFLALSCLYVHQACSFCSEA